MLSVEELTSRTFEERMDDVMRELPLRSSEWTNYNPSDPGITILENLTAFSALQGAEITTLSYRARMALLKMAGFVPARGKCSRVLLSADELDSPHVFPSGQRFHLGNICFETNRETLAGACRLTGVYAYENEEFRDISFVLDKELSVPARIFGEEPKPGNAVYFVFDGDVTDLKEIIMYVRMYANAKRNETVDRTEHIFADTKWEVFTEAGFEEVSVRDYTGSFVSSGEIRLSLADCGTAVYTDTPEFGYCIRCTLLRADYDIVPRMTNLCGFLFEVWQKDTLVHSVSYNRADKINVRSPIGEDVYYLVFGKEQKGSSYRKYEMVMSDDLTGRFCKYSEKRGSIDIRFNETAYGYAPYKCKECVRVLIYNEQMMRSYAVGRVIGFDDQELNLPVSNVVHESFFLIARRKDEEGYLYDFVRPERKIEGGLYYHLLEKEGRIIIEDPGDFIGAELFMGGVAVTNGDYGNITSGNHILIDDEDIDATFMNPGDGTGGCYRETLEQVRARFLRDMKTPFTAVCASDYESLVRTTPGLCIRKTKAVTDEHENMVRVVVMPDTGDNQPKLNDIYIDKITQRLEERRLITTGFQIKQPAYVAVGVKCTVYVKKHFTDCRRMIEDRIKACVDYIHSDRNFGDRLMFEDVFHAIEDLPCVEYVYELSLHSENNKLAQVKENDIIPRYDCICYPGTIQLNIVTSEK